MNFNSTNATIISFVPYSGGKFISNCLSLSRHACPQDAKSAQYLLTHPGDATYRLQQVMSTLPEKQHLKEWRGHEFGDYQLYGSEHLNWIQHGTYNLDNCSDVLSTLSQSSMKFFITDHSGPPTTARLLNVWPNATIIRLINSSIFQDICLKFKSDNIDRVECNGNYSLEKYTQLSGSDWPTWQDFEHSGYNIDKFLNIDSTVREEIVQFYPWNTIDNPVLLFDVDSCIFKKHLFVESLRKLYQLLNFDDFNSNLVGEYWQAYINLHQ